ncbi:TetR/AcrR family transcriptional regulator [Yinghuangia soli]|uniref:TetR family transcriptional regulator C-terminal domain-containing protein n=1 Tax=Yinghuangia soli TaxID=2908204 RepID=A0AA41PXV4_9ACTN|nr:TetR family transcriptional regulator C-terminal domain-containing protein [Yinghuangia soli]MCF2527375.1 TetR family transcriptional regulator C-terminal domain-containing protein [Yinghuangia soli]
MLSHDRARRGPADPQRRERVIAATEEVLLAHGLEGLTHRAVAKQADVPLGSTTYYFATLGDLRHAALQRVVRRYVGWMHGWAEELGRPSPEELATALTDLIVMAHRDHRHQVVVDFELSVAAMRHPELRELATVYTTATVAMLSRMTSPATALALTAAMDGLSMLGLVSPEPLAPEQIRGAFLAILRADAAAGTGDQ